MTVLRNILFLNKWVFRRRGSWILIFFSSHNVKILPMGKSKYVYINLSLNFKQELSMLYNNFFTVYDMLHQLFRYMLLFNNDFELSTSSLKRHDWKRNWLYCYVWLPKFTYLYSHSIFFLKEQYKSKKNHRQWDESFVKFYIWTFSRFRWKQVRLIKNFVNSLQLQ